MVEESNSWDFGQGREEGLVQRRSGDPVSTRKAVSKTISFLLHWPSNRLHSPGDTVLHYCLPIIADRWDESTQALRLHPLPIMTA